jgi:threonine aldolase
LDGARLFNAMVVKNEIPKQYGGLFDTISICFSKSLGAPVGSVLLGSNDHMKKAKKIRKLFGGAMCQVGYLAAAGIYALDHHIERLGEDHQRAKDLGETLEQNPCIKRVEPIETNIVIFNLIDKIDDQKFIKTLKNKNILISSMGNGKLRMVTHLDFTDEMLEIVIKELNNFKI